MICLPLQLFILGATVPPVPFRRHLLWGPKSSDRGQAIPVTERIRVTAVAVRRAVAAPPAAPTPSPAAAAAAAASPPPSASATTAAGLQRRVPGGGDRLRRLPAAAVRRPDRRRTWAGAVRSAGDGSGTPGQSRSAAPSRAALGGVPAPHGGPPGVVRQLFCFVLSSVTADAPYAVLSAVLTRYGVWFVW